MTFGLVRLTFSGAHTPPWVNRMTAEVAVMNKTAVALATDSAVTITSVIEDKITGKKIEREKIFTSVNKLFALSSCRPVGIMVHGNADLMDVPWETVIRVYRDRLRDRGLATVRDYARHFVRFLDKRNPLFGQGQQLRHFQATVNGYFTNQILKHVAESLEAAFKPGTKFTIKDVRKIAVKQIDQHWRWWRSSKRLAHLPAGFARTILRKHKKLSQKIIKDVFGKLELGAGSKRKLLDIVGFLITKDRFPRGETSGVVIAGFGEKENFPSIVAYDIEGVVLDRLKYKTFLRAGGNKEPIAGIFPFAQRDTVDAFISGIHDDYRVSIDKFLERFLDSYSNVIIDEMKTIRSNVRKTLKQRTKTAGKQLKNQFWDAISKYEKEYHIDNIMKAVSFLPKEELAQMAEALVSITSLKRKMSTDKETVGGPTDVAIISKSDGFVWVKKKQPFDSRLNPHLIARSQI